ncbi:MAG: metalloregulator ArsR/SmtB family transcription factor [Maritimibacter sp.]|jgi:ArsR family transcriptional regulator, arsenate/arsenite/antimonite-responsive transcriptional repressor
MQEFMNLTKALSDENRVRILLALSATRELCVCHINELLSLAPSTVSKHLFLLKNARLLTARKDGRWMYYRLNNDNQAPAVVIEALKWITKAISDNPVIEADRRQLKEIMSVPIQSACGRWDTGVRSG